MAWLNTRRTRRRVFNHAPAEAHGRRFARWCRQEARDEQRVRRPAPTAVRRREAGDRNAARTPAGQAKKKEPKGFLSGATAGR